MKKYGKSIMKVTGTVLAFSMIFSSPVLKCSDLMPVCAVTVTVTSMTATQGPEINAGITGGSGFTFPVFNGDESVKFDDVADDLKLFVKDSKTGEWVGIDGNADSGWIYDQNFGHFREGGGGFWFHVKETTYVRLQSAANPSVHLDYTINYTLPERSNYILSADGDTNLTAGETGAVGLVLPKIDGGYPIDTELDSFVYEVKKNGKWMSLTNPESGFSYRSSGYTSTSSANQWGYWFDTIYGLWFQPITEDVSIRVGYPADGVKGHDCKENYVVYNIKGNPDAQRPDPADAEPIELSKLSDPELEGWNMIWHDEFSGDKLDSSSWTHETGYYLSDDPGTWGWGNNELEYYTDSEKNSFVKDGKLTLRLIDEPASFEQDPGRTAPYSSGKLISKDKFSFKYGRIDFCAKLPKGTGIWPALWLLPNDSVYGTWASSGEIDVMEAKGRLDNVIYGTIHYGGTWPANRNTGNEFIFEDGKTYDDGYHVYSCIWEKEMIRWYVDGQCYSVVPYTEWYSGAAQDNPYAPFDEEFYIIMNLAAGGNFDGGRNPDASSVPGEMQVEYVRVYQAEGDTEGSYTDKTGSSSSEPAVIDAAYVLKLQKYLLGVKQDNTGLDFDENGKISITDLIKAKAYILNR